MKINKKGLKKVFLGLSLLFVLSVSISAVCAADGITSSSQGGNEISSLSINNGVSTLTTNTHEPVYVTNETTGTDSGNGSSDNPYVGLDNAISKSTNSVEFILKDGVYSGNNNTGLTITKNITISANTSGNVIFVAKNTNIFNIQENLTVTLNGLKFINGTTTTLGGAINIGENATLIVNNCVFENNTGGAGSNYNTGGGAINVGDSATLNVSNSAFTSNSATLMGGAILGQQKSTIIINNSNFTKNYAKGSNNLYGGAITIRANGKLNISNSKFDGNYLNRNQPGTDGGGAINVAGGSLSFVNDSTFINYSKSNSINGLYIRVDGGTITLKDNAFDYFKEKSIFSQKSTIDKTDPKINDEGNNIFGKSVDLVIDTDLNNIFIGDTVVIKVNVTSNGIPVTSGNVRITVNKTVLTTTFDTTTGIATATYNANVLGTNIPIEINYTDVNYQYNDTSISIYFDVVSYDVIYVSLDGDDNNPGSSSSPVLTFKHALDKVADGGRIYFKNGTYSINDIIDKNVTIIGNETTFTGNGTKRIFDIEENLNVTLNGIKFINGNNTLTGGAINIGNYTNLIVNNCVFENNTGGNGESYNSEGYYRGGGAINVGNYATLNVSNSTFINNSANRIGGAILGQKNSIIIINNSNFTKNYAINKNQNVYGGAIGLRDNGILNISNCKFDGNYLKGKNPNEGGAISVATGSLSFVDYSTFINSPQDSNGKYALYIRVDEGTITLKGNTFDPVENAVKTTATGTIYKSVNLNLTTNLDNIYIGDIVNIKVNVTSNGVPVTSGNVTIKVNNIDLTTTFNTTTGIANATYIASTSGTDIPIEINYTNTTVGYLNQSSATTFDVKSYQEIYVSNNGNDANSGSSSTNPVKTFENALYKVANGGTIYFKDGDYNITNNTINKNVTIIGSGSIFSSDGINHIFTVNENINVSFQNITFKNAKDSAINIGENSIIEIDNCKFVDNSAKNGGAIFTNKNVTLTVNNSEFINNSATDSGGAISLGEDATLNVSNSNFDNNSAANGGGAISIGSRSTSFVDNSTFINSPVSNSGTYIRVDGGTITLKDNTFDTIKSVSVYPDTGIIDNGNIFGKSVNFTITGLNNIKIGDTVVIKVSVTSNGVPVTEGNVTIKVNNIDLPTTFNTTTGIANATYTPSTSGTKIPIEINYTVNSYYYNNKTLSGDFVVNSDNGIIYVSTKGNNSNPGNSPTNPVKTFSYALGIVDNGGRIYFENGTYTIVSELIGKNVTIIGNGSIFTADDNNRIFTVNKNTNVNFQNITFTKAKNSAINIGENSIIEIDNCTFVDNSATTGGAIYIKGTGVTLTVNNSEFSNNKANDVGGAIGTPDSKRSQNSVVINVINSKFNNNFASASGGAIIANGGVNLTVIGSNFTNNSAKKYGGAIRTYNENYLRIENSNFNSNHVSDNNARGGAVNVANTEIIVINSNFTNNYAEDAGGAIRTNGTALIDGCIFIDNYLTDTDEGGSAVYINSPNPININNSVFRDNNGFSVIYSTLSGSVIVNNSQIVNNKGNGISIVNSIGFEIEMSTILNNTGFGISTKDAVGSIHNNRIVYNNGGIKVTGGNVNIYDNWMGNNTPSDPNNVNVTWTRSNDNKTLTISFSAPIPVFNYTVGNTSISIKENYTFNETDMSKNAKNQDGYLLGIDLYSEFIAKDTEEVPVPTDPPTTDPSEPEPEPEPEPEFEPEPVVPVDPEPELEPVVPVDPDNSGSSSFVEDPVIENNVDSEINAPIDVVTVEEELETPEYVVATPDPDEVIPDTPVDDVNPGEEVTPGIDVTPTDDVNPSVDVSPTVDFTPGDNIVDNVVTPTGALTMADLLAEDDTGVSAAIDIGTADAIVEIAAEELGVDGEDSSSYFASDNFGGVISLFATQMIGLVGFSLFKRKKDEEDE